MSKISYLFDTQALKIAPADKPFWYTSGLIGLYFINTQFLCGGEAKAKEILSFIDNNSQEKNFPDLITAELETVYQEHAIYRDIIDSSIPIIEDIIKANNIKYISGGERRDWFFAPIIAQKINTPCLYLYNDLSIRNQSGENITDLDGAKIINIADLLTIGSSYAKKWAPAISQAGGSLVASFNIVDRLQGGIENLKQSSIQDTRSLYQINQDFFDQALQESYISQEQYDMICRYLQDEHGCMRDWLKENPQFIQESLNSNDQKTAKRAKILAEEDLYRLNA